MLIHAGDHLDISIPSLFAHFPGVPAFFFVSGFLIYASYQNSSGFQYFKNRLLRIFPGLIFVTFGGLVVVTYVKGICFIQSHSYDLLIWFLAQITIGQIYNPAIFRDIGVGVINGALWTVTTEIMFYLFIPVIVFLERSLKHVVILLTLLSFGLFSVGPYLLDYTFYRNKTIYDAIAITPITWGWMFGIGILFFKYFKQIKCFIPYMILGIIPMILMIEYGNGILWNSSGNRLGVVYFLCYIGVIFWFSFTLPTVKMRFDLSYGLYIWHMPVINLLLYMSLKNIFVVLGLTILFSLISWHFVESPFLKLKRKSLRKEDS